MFLYLRDLLGKLIWILSTREMWFLAFCIWQSRRLLFNRKWIKVMFRCFLWLVPESISGTIGLRKFCLGIWTSLNFSLKFFNNFVVKLHGVLKKIIIYWKITFLRHILNEGMGICIYLRVSTVNFVTTSSFK